MNALHVHGRRVACDCDEPPNPTGTICGVRDCEAHPKRPRPKVERRRKPWPCRLGIHEHWRFRQYPDDWPQREDGSGPKAPPPPPPPPSYSMREFPDYRSQAICLACGQDILVRQAPFTDSLRFTPPPPPPPREQGYRDPASRHEGC